MEGELQSNEVGNITNLDKKAFQWRGDRMKEDYDVGEVHNR